MYLSHVRELFCKYCYFQETLLRRTCKLVEFENASKALEKAKPKNQEQVCYFIYCNHIYIYFIYDILIICLYHYNLCL